MGLFSTINEQNPPVRETDSTIKNGSEMEGGETSSQSQQPPNPNTDGKSDPGLSIPGKWKAGGRGRPPNWAKGSGIADAGKPSTPRSKSSSSVPAIDPSYFVETVIQLAKCGDDIWRNYLVREIRTRLPDKEADLHEILSKSALNAADEKVLRSILPVLVAKYDILSRMGPEVCLCLWLAQYSVRMVSVTKFVQSFPEQKTQKPQEKQVNETGTNN